MDPKRSTRVFDLSIASGHHNFIAGGFVVHNKPPPRPPFPIQDLAIASATDRSLTLTWSTPDGDEGAPNTYWINTNLGHEETFSVTPKQPGTAESYVLTGLSGNTQYEVTVRSSYVDTFLSEPAVVQGTTL